MKIVQLSEQAKPFQFSYCNRVASDYSSSEDSCYSQHEQQEEESWKEDDTCVQLCVSMPGVKAQDIRLAMTQNNTVLRVWGRSSSTSDNNKSRKRQRLNVREFPIDTQLLDIERAIASIYKDTLVLYAPKKPNTFLASNKSSLLEELRTTTITTATTLSQCS
mmetsp:Transcript_33483/g.81084  ORF Transcript_33483/g.81084 Transcript_33483/m.81084 type:complete len:162 (-) Transcript_33483:2072-2557(-)|eukprot:CAMPEP_0113626974 /NCGR_PEP_ID=MMETSP0017_2-20120614/13959_1 /TAXON_ID=2856 /ORGANISM="Cylindrotheca closterium" /LENGTH=161 /DNA_ID=CAMNT_0000537191 /DNA_START=148 /DNA_END=633 /DNA_ORIENTATION=- /assembly_acc=CAM_ASM_000147